MKYNNIYHNITRLTAIALLAGAVTACGDEDIDNTYSINHSVIELNASSRNVVLDESNPDAVALVVEWNAAHNYGNEFITTYQYQIDAEGSKASTLKEYEDDEMFRREYTNAELQEMLIGHFGCLTSSYTVLNLTVSASFEGPRVVVPDIAAASINIKTYGEKQYLADRLFMGGDALGDDKVELTPTSATSGMYRWTGALNPGKLNFPVIYGDENNAISPDGADAPITEDEMPAVMVDASKAYSWIVPEADNYTVTVNMTNRTVKIIRVGAILEIDKLFMTGTATGDELIELGRTLENANLYAWYGDLKAGKLYMPIEFEESMENAIIPKDKSSHDINDGTATQFDVVANGSATMIAYWEIPADGKYRVVVDTDKRNVTFYSALTDKPNIKVSYNNTVDKINPYTQEVTELWMRGGFNGFAYDAGLKSGFQSKYKLKQSIANPYIFVYQGAALPRTSTTDEWDKSLTHTAVLNFLVSNIESNVYSYGSTAAGKRLVSGASIQVNLGEEYELVPGQGDNRYSYFSIPENCTYVVVDIENLKVLFDNK